MTAKMKTIAKSVTIIGRYAYNTAVIAVVALARSLLTYLTRTTTATATVVIN